MTAPALILGDDTDLTVNVGVDVHLATEIKVALVSIDHKTALAGPYNATSGYTGANWTAGTVVVFVPGADTTGLTVARFLIETRVTIAGKKTTYFSDGSMLAIKGQIP